MKFTLPPTLTPSVSSYDSDDSASQASTAAATAATANAAATAAAIEAAARVTEAALSAYAIHSRSPAHSRAAAAWRTVCDRLQNAQKTPQPPPAAAAPQSHSGCNASLFVPNSGRSDAGKRAWDCESETESRVARVMSRLLQPPLLAMSGELSGAADKLSHRKMLSRLAKPFVLPLLLLTPATSAPDTTATSPVSSVTTDGGRWLVVTPAAPRNSPASAPPPHAVLCHAL